MTRLGLLCALGILQGAAMAQPQAALVCRAGPPASRITAMAVGELQYHLERFMGLKVTCADGLQPRPEGALRFIVGAGPQDAAPLDSGGRFGIAIRGQEVWLWGHDLEVPHPEGWDIRNSKKGSLQAVYQFLEQFGGIRWLMQGDENTVRLDPKAPLNLPASFTRTYEWRFDKCHMDFYGNVGGMDRFLYRNMGRTYAGMGWSFMHNWAGLIEWNRYFAEHPEYYALVGGQRRRFPEGQNPNSYGVQICSSSPALVEIFARNAIASYRETGNDIIPISPNDGPGFCECANCVALDRPDLYASEEVADLPNRRCLSDRVFTFANAVARQVKRDCPELKLGIHLYDSFVVPPRNVPRLESNLVGDLCIDPSQFNDPEYKRQTLKRLHEWAGKGLGGLYMYWYTGTHYWGQVLTVHPHTLGEFIKEAAAVPAVRGIKIEVSGGDAAPNALNYYVFLALMKDPTRGVDEIIDEFCVLAFGPGAAPMKEYFALAEETFMARPSKAWGMDAEVVRWYDDAFFQRAYGLIGEALKRVQGSADQDYRRRLGLMLDALDHTRNKVDLLQSLAGLQAMGVPVTLYGLEGDYRAPITGDPGNRALRDALIDRALQSRARMHSLIWRYDGTGYFSSSAMLRTDGRGRWPRLAEMLGALRGKDALLDLTEAYPFQIDPNDRGEREGWFRPDFAPQGWKSLKLDTVWEEQGFGEPAPGGYDGMAWYRIPLTIPAEHRGSRVELALGAVDDSCWVWVNGKSVGQQVSKTPHAQTAPPYRVHWQIYRATTPRVFDLTEAVRYDGPNLIAVRVESKTDTGGIWKGGYVTFSAPRN